MHVSIQFRYAVQLIDDGCNESNLDFTGTHGSDG